jgi:hypothetical protein
MRRGGWVVTIVAMALATAMGAAGAALPWPPIASQTLAGLFLLVAVTRVAGDLGVRGQQHARHAVAGVAGTGAVWFAIGAVVLGRPLLGVLAGLHVVVTALAFWTERVPGEDPELTRARRERGWLVAGTAGAALSLMALAALPADLGVPGRPWAPSLLASALLVAGWFVARGRLGGLVVSAVAGVFTLVLAAHTLAVLSATPVIATTPAGELVPAIVATAALGVAPAVIALALRLPAVWAVLAPHASASARTLLAVATLPTVTGVALLIL